MTEIPVVDFKTQSADFSQNIDLENTNISIRLIYNTRVNYWFANFETNNNTILKVKMITNSLLLDQYKATLYDIDGDFIIRRVTDSVDSLELTYENFGIDWAFQYLTADEVGDYKTDNGIG